LSSSCWDKIIMKSVVAAFRRHAGLANHKPGGDPQSWPSRCHLVLSALPRLPIRPCPPLFLSLPLSLALCVCNICHLRLCFIRAIVGTTSLTDPPCQVSALACIERHRKGTAGG
jgi:hypothetical protein